jgi:polyisoprenoid-binding protein YceI
MRLLVTFALFALAHTVQASVPATSVAPVPKGAYTIDKPHASLIFRVNHLGFSTFTCRFTRFDAGLQLDPTNMTSSRAAGVTLPIVLEARYNGGYAGHPMDPHARVGFSRN